MSDLFEFGKKILANQPFSQLIGTELDTFEPGVAILSLTVRDELKQQHGFVHGGVISYLADNALTYAGGSELRPAMGNKLVAKATIVSSGKTQAVCQCKITAFSDTGEKLVAVAQGTITKVVI